MLQVIEEYLKDSVVRLREIIFCSVRVANELGRGSSKAAKFSILITVLTSFVIGLVLFLVFLFLRERLAYIFTTDSEVAKAVADLSPLLSFSILLNSVQPVLSGILFFLLLLLLICNFLKLKQCMATGVSVGAGWQSIVAYVNIASYYLIGIPVGLLLNNLLHLDVKVTHSSYTFHNHFTLLYCIIGLIKFSLIFKFSYF